MRVRCGCDVCVYVCVCFFCVAGAGARYGGGENGGEADGGGQESRVPGEIFFLSVVVVSTTLLCCIRVAKIVNTLVLLCNAKSRVAV